MKITWYGHSCFKLSSESGSVIFDPYARGYVPGVELPEGLEADLVLCSHAHDDHNAADRVKLTGKSCRLTVETLHTWHDDAHGNKRGANLVHIVSGDGFAVAHLGDLGHIPSETQLLSLQGLDAVMIPVGGYYTIDAAEARELVEKIAPVVTMPMHYRGEGFGFDVIGTVEDYIALCPGEVLRINGNSYELSQGESAKTVVLSL